MLIGNRQRLAFELIPVSPSWERRYGPERAAWAGLSIWVADENLCRHVLPGSAEIHDFLFVPLGPIADWLTLVFPALTFEERAALFPTTRRLHEDVDRWGRSRPPGGMDEDAWLDAREDWWSRHFMRAAADRAQIPNLAMVRDDEKLAVVWAPPRFSADDAPLLLSQGGEFALPWHEGQAVLDDFVSRVAEWLREAGATDAFPWAGAAHPLRATAATLSQALELFTARSLPDLEALFRVQGIEELLERIQLPASADDPAASTHCQILRDLSPALSSDVASLLEELGQRTVRAEPDGAERWRRARGIALDAARSATSLVESGQAAAVELRRSLDLHAEPLPEIGGFVERLGLRYHHSPVSGGRDRMIVGARESGSLAAVTLQTVRTERLWGQRFEAARALGHGVLDPLRGGAMGAASGPYAQASRRMRSGAFAAELLLPEGAIERASAGELDGAAEPRIFESLIEQYGVGARTCAYQLWNRGWLSSPIVRDELIDRFAAFA